MMKMKLPGAWALILAFVVAGCSPVQLLETQKVDGFDLSKYASYNYYEIAIDTIDTPEFYERLGWIADELNGYFASRGVDRVKTDPELLVNIGLVFEEKVQTRETDFVTDAPRYMGNMNYKWESETVEVGTYTEGTMVMHLVDASTSKLLYEGIVQSVVLKSDNQSRKNIKAAVDKLFKELN